MISEEQRMRYEEDLSKAANNEEILRALEKQKKDPDFEERIQFYCESLVDLITRVNYKYTPEFFKKDKDVEIYLKIAKYLPDKPDYLIYRAVENLFRGKNKEAAKLFFQAEDYLPVEEMQNMSLEQFAFDFMVVFKGGFPGFWKDAYEYLESAKVPYAVLALCKAVPTIYESDDNEVIKAELEKILAMCPDSSVVKELLGYIHYSAGEWGNAVAFFEQVEIPIIFVPDDLHFMMAWGYGKLKETKNEIEAYEKSYQEYPNGFCTLNNLGYAYYKAKQYNKALNAFEECLEKNWDVKYAANNYVRTLLAMQRFKDAKVFLKKTEVKVAKALRDKVEKAEATNKRVGKDPEIVELSPVTSEHEATAEKPIDLGVKKHQFSQEKILEDELTARIEAGLPVFGKNLKVYRRKGVYGRQYILPNGKRLDLLTEDDKGDLYVIELKKDSGYDDAYLQTVEYLEWFEKNWKDKVKVYGIICLNDPSKELLERVHKDHRMKVYEYQISYTER